MQPGELTSYRRRLESRGARARRPVQAPWEDQGVAGVDGNDVYVSKPARPGVKRDARDVRDALTDRRLAAARRLAEYSPDEYRKLAAHLRAKNPGLSGALTDDELIRTVYETAHREATEAAYKKLRRDKVVIP